MRNFRSFLPLLQLLVAVTLSSSASFAEARSLWSTIRGGGASTATKTAPTKTPDEQQPSYYQSQELTIRTKHTAAITTKLADTLQGFQQVVQQSSRAASRQPQDIHVGKLLSALREMATFMDKTAGMSQVAKTMTTNIAKLEDLYRRAPQNQRDSLMALLQYELDSGVHSTTSSSSSHQLQDKSGAMGLVWLGRNISYQRYMYQLVLHENQEPLEAAQQAFAAHLRPHLHWTVANVLQAAIRSLTPSKRTTLLATLGGFAEDTYDEIQDAATRRDIAQLMDLWQPLLDRLQQILVHELNLLPAGQL